MQAVSGKLREAVAESDRRAQRVEQLEAQLVEALNVESGHEAEAKVQRTCRASF
jgi:hypothetical protein